VTDVAAEGLDLQRAARVVHYDLPWTPMRIEQREGRSVRYGSHYDRVEVVRFGVPAVLERSLRLEARPLRGSRRPGGARTPSASTPGPCTPCGTWPRGPCGRRPRSCRWGPPAPPIPLLRSSPGSRNSPPDARHLAA
jgi:hypothetical protein